MKKAVFLDRDGVINREAGDYTWRMDDFELLDGVVPALKWFMDKGYDLFIITNQGGIAKGLYTREDVEKLHHHLQELLGKEGIVLKEIYYCPHHPDFGNCLCRKPGSLLIEKAMARFQVDAASSYFIGDRDRDVEAGSRAGVTGILVESNRPLTEVLEQVK